MGQEVTRALDDGVIRWIKPLSYIRAERRLAGVVLSDDPCALRIAATLYIGTKRLYRVPNWRGDSG
jgi:hypothetical protein